MKTLPAKNQTIGSLKINQYPENFLIVKINLHSASCKAW